MPDVSPEYPGSCGRCYELRCRGMHVVSADGSVDLDRSDACYDSRESILVKVVDTCPCVGNEVSLEGRRSTAPRSQTLVQLPAAPHRASTPTSFEKKKTVSLLLQKWCCGDHGGLQHFDLADGAFRRLAPQGLGIIGLDWRQAPCELQNGSATQQDWDQLAQADAAGASTEIFVGGVLGQGWKKTVGASPEGGWVGRQHVHCNACERAEEVRVPLPPPPPTLTQYTVLCTPQCGRSTLMTWQRCTATRPR